MRYEILGPLRLVNGDHYSTINAQKINTILAALLIRSGQVVGRDQLIGEVWGEDIPRRATAGIHVYISQLRKFLGCTESGGSPIVTRPPGYVLQLGSSELDLKTFQRLVGRGRDAVKAGRCEKASGYFEGALSLWRGPALDDLRDGPIVNGFTTSLEETRLECIEMLADCELRAGRHRELVGRLYPLVMEHPLREVFHRQLMLALYRSERQAEALEVYQSVRRTLNDELGLEPGRALKELQAAILADDDRLQLDCPAA